MNVEPYLFFNGNCEAALNFYHDVLHADTLMMMRFGDAPDPGMCPPGQEAKIMHASIRIGNSTVMASDGDMSGGAAPMGGFSLSISAKDVSEGQRLFNALASGGTVQMPYGKTFWSPGFGMLKDKFGVSWMVNVEHATGG